MRIERAATIMETFSYHYQHPFLLDSDQIVEEMSNGTFESCSSFNGMSTAYPFEETKIIDCSSSVVSMDKKRKNREGSSLSSAQSKEIKESKIRKTKRPIRGIKDTQENKSKSEEKIEVETGYVHVRARRGQATDSHSLAERVRREKISERMKMLQGLVPGCEKVAGKALMLDEIINYVQSLQNQIEFLSMRLASMSPILYDFGLDFDILMNQQKLQRIGSMSQDQPLAVPASITKASSSQPTAFDAQIKSYHPMVDTATFLPLQGQEAFSFSQDSASFLMQEGSQSQGLLNQVDFNMCSFQQRQKKRTSLA